MVMSRDESRLSEFQRRRVRAARAPEVAAAWAAAGVTASVLSDVRRDEVIKQLRGGGCRKRQLGSIQSITAGLREAGDMVVIIAWDIDNEPALLIRSEALAQPDAVLRTIYPDGFIAAAQPLTRALIVDFDEVDFVADEVQLAAKS